MLTKILIFIQNLVSFLALLQRAFLLSIFVNLTLLPDSDNFKELNQNITMVET